MLIIYSKSYCHAFLFMLLLLLLLLLGFVCTWGVCMVPLTSTGLCPTPFIVVKSISTRRNLIFRRLFTLIWWQLIQGRQLNSFSSGLVKTIPLNWLLAFFFFKPTCICIIFYSVWSFFLCKSPANCNLFFKICLEIPFLKKICPNSYRVNHCLLYLTYCLWLLIPSQIHHTVQVLYDYSKVEHPSEIFPNLKWYKVKKQLP